MELSDLFCGAYVSFNDEEFMITSIDVDSVGLHHTTKNYHEVASEQDLYPFVVDDTWLKDLAFVAVENDDKDFHACIYRYEHKELLGKGVYFYFDSEPNLSFEGHATMIAPTRYVHDLQRAFKTTHPHKLDLRLTKSNPVVLTPQ